MSRLISFLHHLALALDQRKIMLSHSEKGIRTEISPDEVRLEIGEERKRRKRLANLEAQNQIEVLTSNLREQDLFPEPDGLHDPEGDPEPPKNPWSYWIVCNGVTATKLTSTFVGIHFSPSLETATLSREQA